MSRKFQRRIEDFICAHCGVAVVGDGYTNHCPKCLYSCHVDVNPGDRAEACGGLMTPVAIEQTSDGYIIGHKCERCGHIMHCRSHKNDDIQKIIALARSLANGR